MGCDIHTRVEYFNNDEHWVCGDTFRLNPYYSGSDPWEDDPYEVLEVCGGRNYELFAVLANVRNYGDMEYIDDPRGIPDDACRRTYMAHAAWGEDAHSASWFTLKEIMDWNKTERKMKRRGMVSPEAAARLDRGEDTPDTWCQGTNQEGWVWRTWEEDYQPLDELIRVLIQRGRDLRLWYEWEDMEQIEAKAHKLRFIFWFDN